LTLAAIPDNSAASIEAFVRANAAALNPAHAVLAAGLQIPTKSPADSEMMSPGVPK
jgi:hypothetical protein